MLLFGHQVARHHDQILIFIRVKFHGLKQANLALGRYGNLKNIFQMKLLNLRVQRFFRVARLLLQCMAQLLEKHLFLVLMLQLIRHVL